jgi:3-mercaptopyruvate sulfurtransferase SseA
MKTEADWDRQAKGIVKAELKRRGLTYEQLAEQLAAIGVRDSARNITNKINRGRFTAVFMLQCLEAMGCQTVRLTTD